MSSPSISKMLALIRLTFALASGQSKTRWMSQVSGKQYRHNMQDFLTHSPTQSIQIGSSLYAVTLLGEECVVRKLSTVIRIKGAVSVSGDLALATDSSI
jgi:hypothetical protein